MTPLLTVKQHTFERYFYFSKKIRTLSIARALQYELLETYPLKGKILDFGGGEKSKYRNMLQCSFYQSVNIDPKIQPTWVIGTNEPLPCETDSFDTVISLNTLEHIFNPRLVLGELFRVLKPGGEILLSVPFLYPVHAHPDDFFRPTPSWFQTALSQSGFGKIEIIPLWWGPYTTAMLCGNLPGPLKGVRQQIALFKDLIYIKIRNQFRKSSLPISSPVAHFVRAVK